MSEGPVTSSPKWYPNWGSVIVSTLICLCLLSLQQVLAQTPPAASSTSFLTINYQGRLTQTNGLPLNEPQDITFRLYTTPTGGPAVWQEPWAGVETADGLFSVLLGTHDPTLATVIQTYNQLWLGITVGSDPEMLPRTQFGSVPFAVQALTVPDGSITSEKLNLTNGITVTGDINFTGILTGPNAYWADYRSYIRFLAEDGVNEANLCPEGGVPVGVTGPTQSLELQTGDDIAAALYPNGGTCINVHQVNPCGSIIGNNYPYDPESCSTDFSGKWAPFYWWNGETTHGGATNNILGTNLGCYGIKYACVDEP